MMSLWRRKKKNSMNKKKSKKVLISERKIQFPDYKNKKKITNLGACMHTSLVLLRIYLTIQARRIG